MPARSRATPSSTETFVRLCREAGELTREVRLTQLHIWESGAVDDLLQATQRALRAGVDPARIYQEIDDIRPEAEPFPPEVDGLLMQLMNPDMLLPSGMPLLHNKLMDGSPPKIRAIADISTAGCGWNGCAIAGRPASVYLEDLLAAGPDTSLTSRDRQTALHLLVRQCLDKSGYFPDLEGLALINHVRIAGLPKHEACFDSERAAYLEHAFPLMLQRGFSPTAPDSNGKTAEQLLRQGLERCTAELQQLTAMFGAHAAQCQGLRRMQRALRGALRAADAAAQQQHAEARQQPRHSAARPVLTTPSANGLAVVVVAAESPAAAGQNRHTGLKRERDDAAEDEQQRPNHHNLLRSNRQQHEETLQNEAERDVGDADAAGSADDYEDDGGAGDDAGDDVGDDVGDADGTVPVWRWGKHRGTPIAATPGGYVHWICREPGYFTDEPHKVQLLQQMEDAGLLRKRRDGEVVPLVANDDGYFGYAWD